MRSYASYRPGFWWAPRIPEHWGHASLRWLADIYAGGTPDKENLAFWTRGTIPWLNSGAVNDWAISTPSALITEEAYAKSSARWVPAGSVVMGLAGQGKTKGTSARLQFDATTNQSMAALVPGTTLDQRFLHFWLVANYQSIRNLAGGDRRDGLNLQHVASIQVPLPSLDEQRAIADFLDREAARIDTLIAEQQRLIDLLRERRDAVIARATGWDGVARVGWADKRLSWLFEGTASGTTPSNEDIVYSGDAEIPWVTTGELRETEISTTQRGIATEVLDRYSALRIHPRGSLLIAMYGATIGRLAILGVDAASNQACCALIGPTGTTTEFVQYSLIAAKPQLLLDAAGGGQPNINQDKIRSFRIPVPPLDEQRMITEYLDSQTAKIDSLIAETELFIELSRERRSSLITAAVTGQIDVREEVA